MMVIHLYQFTHFYEPISPENTILTIDEPTQCSVFADKITTGSFRPGQ